MGSTPAARTKFYWVVDTFHTMRKASTKEGKIIAARLGKQELLARFPDLYQGIKTGAAGNDARLRDF